MSTPENKKQPDVDAVPEGDRLEGTDFIRAIVAEDCKEKTYDGRVVTRFPPEPNGYPHIGHAKSICLNFGIAAEFGGICNLRMDDTNPTTEDEEYARALEDAVRWLGFDPGPKTYYASDYFDHLYTFAEQMIKEGKAYVDSLNEEEIRLYRGTVTESGRESPYRNRSVEENLELFRRMKAGDFPDGAHVLRAKIDMTAPNMKMRDPLLYRIRHAHHYRTGDKWCIYPMYDFAHPLSDAIEGVTHSICTLEFENNRQIYNWLVDYICEPPMPQQYEFARLNLEYTVMSKRKLLELVEGGYVNGWDDPRLPTIAGMRRRGYTPESVRNFCERIGVSKVNSRVDLNLLEHCVRDDLNHKAPRVMCVLTPLKVVITNYPADQVEQLDASYWPRDVPKEGSRSVPFSQTLYIEREDFRENPPKGFFRLSPGQEVRLRYAYVIRCDEVLKNDDGEVVELRCSYDPATLGQQPRDRKVKGTIHWVSAAHALPAEVRLYDRLFTIINPETGTDSTDDSDLINDSNLTLDPTLSQNHEESNVDFKTYLNLHSAQILSNSYIEPSVADDPVGSHYQFERQGYFISDPVDSRPDALIFNRVVTLRDSWAKVDGQDTTEESTQNATRHSSPKEEAVHVGSRSETRDQARVRNPELAARYDRYQQMLNLSEEAADILTGQLELSDFFEAALETGSDAALVAAWMTNELMGELKERSLSQLSIDGQKFGLLVGMVADDTISSAGGKKVLAEMVQSGEDPVQIVETQGLKQVSNVNTLEPIIEQIITQNSDKAEQYRNGKTGLLGFFTGQVMRTTGGAANPQIVQEILRTKLDSQ